MRDGQQGILGGGVSTEPDRVVLVETEHGIVVRDGLPGGGSGRSRERAWTSTESSDCRGDVIRTGRCKHDSPVRVIGQDAGGQQHEQLERRDCRPGFVTECGPDAIVVPGDPQVASGVSSQFGDRLLTTASSCCRVE